jgi:hypothetical protein
MRTMKTTSTTRMKMKTRMTKERAKKRATGET